MPIKIPASLPAHDVLRREGVMVVSEEAAVRQDIRPLQIGLLNLMPDKVRTETQIARLVGSTPLQIELTLIRMTGHRSKNTSAEHMEAFYITFAAARARKFDGFIITGAPDPRSCRARSRARASARSTRPPRAGRPRGSRSSG